MRAGSPTEESAPSSSPRLPLRPFDDSSDDATASDAIAGADGNISTTRRTRIGSEVLYGSDSATALL